MERIVLLKQQCCTSIKSLNINNILKSYLYVSVSFVEDHFDKLWVLQSIQKVGIKTVEIRLNADTLHHQVLRHPGHKLILHCLFQLLHLKNQKWFKYNSSNSNVPKTQLNLIF